MSAALMGAWSRSSPCARRWMASERVPIAVAQAARTGARLRRGRIRSVTGSDTAMAIPHPAIMGVIASVDVATMTLAM